MARNKPAHEIRVGAIRLSIWSNESRFGSHWFSLKLERFYKDEHEQWQVTQNFKQHHLSDVAKALSIANQWMDERTLEPEAKAMLRGIVQATAQESGKPKRRKHEN